MCHYDETLIMACRYQRAFIDFFEDQLVKYGYDWHALLDEFLLQGKEPLINNLIAGLGHPLIHLGYGHELSSRTIAIEGLAMAACFYNDWHVFLDDPKYTKPAQHPSDSLFTILDRVTHDKTFDGLSDHQGSDNIDGRVQVVDWLEKPGTDFPDVVGLAVVNVNVGEVAVLEKRQEGPNCVVGGRRI